MKRLGLEWKVTVWSGVVIAISLLICGIGGALFLHAQTVKELDRQAGEVADHFFQLVREHGGEHFDYSDLHEVHEWLPAEHEEDIVDLYRGGEPYFRSKKLEDTGLPSLEGAHFVQLPWGRMRMVTFSNFGIVMRVAVPTETLDDLSRTLTWIFIVGLPVMFLFVIFGGRWIAQRTLEPVHRIANEAEQITSQHLDRRMPVPVAKDEIQRLATVLNSLLDRLQMSFQQAMRFSADASHELKTPLTVLHSELEALLASPTLCEEDRVSVADALETAKRINAITRSLLLLAHADAGHLQLDLQPVDFVHLLADCVEDARIMSSARDIILEEQLPASAHVLGEPVRLRQIVGNLLDNAVKYNMPGGKIRIALVPGAGLWMLDVSNTGPGISADQKPRIFERFYRGQHHARIGGHGLGLSLAHELARAHGGSLELLRSDEEWTTFRLTLRLAKTPDEVPSETADG